VVFGPGYGESIAVRIPDGGWLVTDSLAGRGRWATFVPAAELLRELNEKVSLLILTHPHDDHVGGFDRLVTDFANGSVGAVEANLPEDGFTENDSGTAVLAKSNCAKAVVAIRRYWREHPTRKWEIVADSSTRSIGSGHVEALHPSQDYLDGGTPDPAKAPNSYSTPVLVEWEEVRIVLGADLPTLQWGSVLAVPRSRLLADHALLKVPHHGSETAQVDQLVSGRSPQVTTAVTPWNLGRKILPQLGTTAGAQWLLARSPMLALTSPGRVTARLPQPVALAQLQAAVERRALPGGGVMEVRRDFDPDESWVAFSFDRGGALTSEHYGREARRITP
jgi:beta-lactamase superfamily II metal-dependent hydrolase